MKKPPEETFSPVAPTAKEWRIGPAEVGWWDVLSEIIIIVISITTSYFAARYFASFIDQGASQWRALATTILPLAMIVFLAWLLRLIDSKTHILPSNRRALMEPGVPLSISVKDSNASVTADVTLHTRIVDSPQASTGMAKASTVMIEILHSCEEHYKKFDRPCDITLKEPKGTDWLLSISPRGLTPRDVEKMPVQIFGMTLLGRVDKGILREAMM